MADEPQVLKGIDYRSAFPFTNIFRSFRIAVHPSKLGLALVMLLALYLGGRLMDGLWFARHSPVPGAIALYQQSEDSRAYKAAVDQRREAIVAQYANALGELDKSDLKTPEDRLRAARAGLHLGDLKKKIYEKRDRNIEAGFASLQGDTIRFADAEVARLVREAIDQSIADETLQAGLEARIARHAQFRAAEVTRDRELKAEGLTDDQRRAIDDRRKGAETAANDAERIARERAGAARDEAKKKASEFAADKRKFTDDINAAYRKGVQELYANASRQLEAAKQIRGEGVFMSLFVYQVSQVDAVVQGVVGGNFLGNGGVVSSIWNFLTVGPGWLITQHPFYAILFIVWFLLLWSIFGGAICRIAAVHAARDEKISVRESLKFSTGKLISFFSAPLIPLIVLVVIGLVVAAGGFVGNIPWIGPIVIGAAFFLALIAGLLMTLVLLGTIGGFNLMYPTIAVEGSDSFDAISRSFSYLYARPWRLAFYTLVAVIYGALTYLFVRFFIFILLSLTHFWVDVGHFTRADNAAPLWNTLWSGPASMWNLTHDIDYSVLGGMQSIGAFLIAFWVYLTITMLGAFAISFYFSANTIIYYLMRREVDATELDDVHLDHVEDDLHVEPAAVPAPAVVAPAADSTPGTVVQNPTDNPPPQA